MYRKKFIDRLREKYQKGGFNFLDFAGTTGEVAGKQVVKKGLQTMIPRLAPIIGTAGGMLSTGALGYETFKRYGDELPNLGENTKRAGGGNITVGDLAAHSGLLGMGSMKQMGGTRLPGGSMNPIPGSDAVEFEGATHDQGGIMLDAQTEVEDGETMDQVTMAKKGGKRDYFFSSYLKKGGRSFADMHKDILRNGGDQEEINMLARMQEEAAGRNPNKVAKLGGVMKYQTGGELETAQNAYNKHEANKPTFDLKEPVKPRKLSSTANASVRKMHEVKMQEYQAELDKYNAAKAEYETALAEWEATEEQLSTDIKQAQEIQDKEEAEAAEKAEAERIKQEKIKAENDALIKEAKDLGIDLPEEIRPSEIKKLITKEKAKQTTAFKKKEGEEGVPEGQELVNIGGKEFYLDKEEDNRLYNIATTLGDEFGPHWISKADPEILEQLGIETFDDLLADGAEDSSIIEAYQTAWNKKYPEDQIQVDGDLGQQTLLTGVDRENMISTVEEPRIPTPEDNIDLRLESEKIKQIPTPTDPEEVDPGGPDSKRIVDPIDPPVYEGGDRFFDAAKDLLNLDITNKRDYRKANRKLYYDEDADEWKLREKKGRGDVPWQAYAGMGAGLIPAAFSLLYKQPPAQQAEYTPGFRSPVVPERGVAPKLERYDYNQDIANVGAEVRGMNKYIETSGGGPANMINKMMAFSKGQQAKDKIRAAETRANIGVQNTEAQLEQQMTLDNLRRSQQASIFNAQMIRAEAARKDQIDEMNTQRRQKRQDDMEFQKYAGVSSLAQSLQTGFGDILDYKADIAMAEAIGSDTGVYQRSTVPFIEGLTWDPDTQSFKIKS